MKTFVIILMCSLANVICSQKIINGNFEINSATNDQINLSNSSLNSMLNSVTAFGSYGDVDIISSSVYGGGGPKDGKWYIALTGGKTDIVALRLTEPLKRNRKYFLTFYDRKDRNHTAEAISIGVSANDHSLGRMVYTSDELPQLNKWTKRSCSFVATENESFITVFMEGGSISDWVNIDHFVLSESNEIIQDTLDHFVQVDHQLKKDSLTVRSDSASPHPLKRNL